MTINFSLIIFSTIIFLLFLFPVGQEGDFFHHINTGRYIAENYQLPYFDQWTFTAKNHPWTSHSWASGLLFYELFLLFGHVGISLFCAFIATISFLLGYFLLRSYSVSKFLSIISLVTIIPLVQARWPARPEILSYPLALCLLLIDRLSTKKPNLEWLFLPIILFWANFYGSSVIIGVFLVFLISLRNLWNRNTKTLKMLPLVFLASLINGYGFDSLLYFVKLQEIAPFQLEWSSIPSILSSAPYSYFTIFKYKIIFYSFYFLSLIILIISFHKILRKNLFLLILSSSLIIPFFSFRELPLASFLSLPLLGVLLNQLKDRVFFLMSLIMTAICIIISISINKPIQNLNTPPFSQELIGFIRTHNIQGDAVNNQNLGAYLSYYLYPDIKVSIDTRDDLFLKTSVLRDFLLSQSSKDVLTLLKDYKADLIIINYTRTQKSYQKVFHSADWKIIFLNDEYFIAARTSYLLGRNIATISDTDPYSK